SAGSRRSICRLARPRRRTSSPFSLSASIAYRSRLSRPTEGILSAMRRAVTLTRNDPSRKKIFMARSLRSLPLRALVTFRAAGQHLNFTKASGDLGVTREAVSGQIRTLEDHLGVRLFRRLHRGLALTEAGQRLFESVTLGLDSIAATAEDLRPTRGKSTVS